VMVSMDAGNQIGIEVVGAQIMIGIDIRCPIDQEKNNAKANGYDGQFQISHGSSHVRSCESVKRVNQPVSISCAFSTHLIVDDKPEPLKLNSTTITILWQG